MGKFNNGGCHMGNAACESIGPGKATCTCNPGFIGDGVTCLAINLCERFKNGNCDSNAHRHPTGPGRSICSCNAQYEGDGVTCRPVDYCSSASMLAGGDSTNNSHVCSPNAKCITSLGTYTCKCNAGYHGNGRQCSPNVFCDKDEIGCHSERGRCRSLGSGRFGCGCRDGFTGNGRECAPLDACTTSPCDVHASCRPTGPGTRVCICKPGFRGHGTPGNCKLVDPCLVDNGNCHASAKCVSTGLDVKCTCPPGYSGNGFLCEEQNKCRVNNGGCHEYADCIHKGSNTSECKCMLNYLGDGVKACHHPAVPVSGADFALFFNGRSDYVSSTSRKFIIAGPNAYTISVWVRPQPFNPKVQQLSTIISRCEYRTEELQGDCWYIAINRAGVPVFYRNVGHPFTFASRSVSYSNWNHIGVVFRDGHVQVSINGTLSDPHAGFGNHKKQYMTDPEKSIPTILGARYSPGKPLHDYFWGEMDDLRILNYAQDEDEMLVSMNRSCNSADASLRMCFRFNEGKASSTAAVVPSGETAVVASFAAGLDKWPIWTKSAVPLHKLCPNSCSGHGKCDSYDRLCRCWPGWKAEPSCLTYECPGKPRVCSGHGICAAGFGCNCSDGWSNDECSDRSCPAGCSHNGRCNVDSGECVCDEGFSGRDCSLLKCPKDCSGQGKCDWEFGNCSCEEDFYGLDCFHRFCPKAEGKECAGHGKCVNETCICDPGFTGHDCSELVEVDCSSLLNCWGRGQCVFDTSNPKASGICLCAYGWTGASCNLRVCPGGCSGSHGTCDHDKGQCICRHGFFGTKCQDTWSCPNNCSVNGVSHGDCLRGKCICKRGYCGQDCSTEICPNKCSGHGSCTVFGCECGRNFQGKDCSEHKSLPMRCTTVCRSPDAGGKLSSEKCYTSCQRHLHSQYPSLLGDTSLEALTQRTFNKTKAKQTQAPDAPLV